MDLTKILKVGNKVYSPIGGYGTVIKITNHASLPIEVKWPNDNWSTFTKEGKYYSDAPECLLFPSKENRDWSTWKTKKECPFKPYDKVLVRDTYSGIWCADIFSHFDDGTFNCIGSIRNKCIPYNKETQHLVGTNQDCPDKYKIW